MTNKTLTASYFVLCDAVDNVKDHKRQLIEAVAERDALIAKAYFEGTSIRSLAEATGVSRQRIHQIVNEELAVKDKLETIALQLIKYNQEIQRGILKSTERDTP